MVKCARRIDGRGLYYLFACVFNIFIYFIFLFKKKRGPERGPEWGPKGVQKGVQEGGSTFYLHPSKPASRCFLFSKMNSRPENR